MSGLAPAALPATGSMGAERGKLPKAAWLAGAVLSAGVAAFSYRYLAKVGPVPPTIASNKYFNPWIIVHAAGAATALLLGPVQFLPVLRRRWPVVHRWTGRTYVAGCLVGGASALVLAAGVSTGRVAAAGFGALGTYWLYATAQGWRMAYARQFSGHAQWMVRSFALTFSAVTLRVYLLTVRVAGLDMMTVYPAIAWLCWVPNAIVAEAYLKRARGSFLRDRSQHPQAAITSALVAQSAL